MATFPKGFQYRPIYQGIPLDAVKEDLQLRGETSKANLDTYNKVMEYAATIRALPGDQQYLSNAFKVADEQIKHITDQTQGSQRWDLATSAVNNVRAKFLADPTITAIKESYANFAKGEETKQKLRGSGVTPLEFTDFSNHRTVNEDGSINIYQPVVEAKGDYLKEAYGLWKTLEPDILNAGLTKSDVAGILEGKTIKGISPQKVRSALSNISNAYKESDSGRQQRRLKASEGSTDPDTDIDNFLLGVGMLRTFTQEGVQYTEDKQWDWERRAEFEMGKTILDTQAKLAVRQKLGRGNYDPETANWFSPRKAVERGIQGDAAGKISYIGINNKELIEGLSYIQAAPNVDQYKFVGLGADKLNKDKESIILEGSPKIVGIIPTRVEEGYQGGFYATVKYKKDGDTRTGNIIIKGDDPSISNKVNTLSLVEEAIKKEPAKHGYVIDDTSGILNFAQEKLPELSRRSGLLSPGIKLQLQVLPDGNSSGPKTGTVKPVFRKQGSDVTIKQLSQAELDYLGLLPAYNMEQIYNLTSELLVPSFKTYIQTKKTLQEE